MTNKEYLFTSESVSEGHPDKVWQNLDMVVQLFVKRSIFEGSL